LLRFVDEHRVDDTALRQVRAQAGHRESPFVPARDGGLTSAHGCATPMRSGRRAVRSRYRPPPTVCWRCTQRGTRVEAQRRGGLRQTTGRVAPNVTGTAVGKVATVVQSCGKGVVASGRPRWLRGSLPRSARAAPGPRGEPLGHPLLDRGSLPGTAQGSVDSLPVRIRPRWRDQPRAHALPHGVRSRRDRGRPSG
jgi:hypothetical protein